MQLNFWPNSANVNVTRTNFGASKRHFWSKNSGSTIFGQPLRGNKEEEFCDN